MEKKMTFRSSLIFLSDFSYCETLHLLKAGAEIPLSGQACKFSGATTGEFVEI